MPIFVVHCTHWISTVEQVINCVCYPCSLSIYVYLKKKHYIRPTSTLSLGARSSYLIRKIRPQPYLCFFFPAPLCTTGRLPVVTWPRSPKPRPSDTVSSKKGTELIRLIGVIQMRDAPERLASCRYACADILLPSLLLAVRHGRVDHRLVLTANSRAPALENGLMMA
ncbi:hypothetical protein BJX63DRAFT_373278 [Aspergillus granulosus]|uniref:Uncharacterized protein n=1 Tax=Aspergillus granulosus TaxID=176169 RepID=A0ABR4H0N0_9EURO